MANKVTLFTQVSAFEYRCPHTGGFVVDGTPGQDPPPDATHVDVAVPPTALPGGAPGHEGLRDTPVDSQPLTPSPTRTDVDSLALSSPPVESFPFFPRKKKLYL